MYKTGDTTVGQVRMGSGFMVPQVKICGLTRKKEAVACAALGANAIGFIFYAKSPRFVTLEQASDIATALPSRICRVGVFVDEDYEKIVQKAHRRLLFRNRDRSRHRHPQHGCGHRIQV